jgi:hypothetical protein
MAVMIGVTVCWPGASDTGCLPVQHVATIDSHQVVVADHGYDELSRLVNEGWDGLGEMFGDATDAFREAREEAAREEAKQKDEL